MRAIIDATGLPQAVSYYRMFPREPARSSEDDMTIDRIIPVHHITLEAVLDQMLAAKADREVLIVAHGEARGLIMHLSAKRSVSALKEALDLVSRVGAALARRAAIRAQSATDQASSWGALAEELKPGSVQGASTAQHYDVYVPGRRNPLDGLIVPDAFDIRVWEISRHPHHLYASRAAAGSWSYVKAWVDEHIMRLSRYQRGGFWLAGLWTFGRNSQPFAAPLDQEYRDVLACSGRSATGGFPAALTPGQGLA